MPVDNFSRLEQAPAFGFAIFARGRDSEFSFLDSWQDSLKRLRMRRTSRSSRQSDEADYVRQPSGEDDTTSRH